MLAVEFRGLAARQVDAIDRWWRINRSAAPDLFRRQLEAAVERLRSMPDAGTPYPYPRRQRIRRLLLSRVGYHLYYRIEGRALVILRVWHARRGSGPF